MRWRNLSQSRGWTSYAEGKIVTPLVRGDKTWEIRIILSSLNISEGPVKPKFWYAKVGSGPLTANRAQGGTSEEAQKIVWEAFRKLHPTAKRSRLEKMVNKFLEDLWVSANIVASHLGAHLTELKEQFLPDFPMEIVSITDVAIDFMGMVVGEGRRKTLKPCLVDVTFHYATGGLQKEDRLVHVAVQFLQDWFSEEWLRRRMSRVST